MQSFICHDDIDKYDYNKLTSSVFRYSYIVPKTNTWQNIIVHIYQQDEYH